ncbi:MAG: hypothetical protein ABH885_06930, partial [Candidatus Omnitrophota bacterium]
RRTALEGFRTFIKTSAPGGSGGVYEPFRLSCGPGRREAEQTLAISPHELRIEEVSKKHALKTEVVYFTVANEDFPGLARILTIRNMSPRGRAIEVIDGMPKLSPYGMNQYFMKHMSRTIEAWMEIDGIEERTPFYRLKVDASDVSQVEYITSGNFYLSVTDDGKRPGIIVDPSLVFGDFDDLTRPGLFQNGNFRMPPVQSGKNTTPSAFSHAVLDLPAGSSRSIMSVVGYAESFAGLKGINRKVGRRFFDEKRRLNREEIENISSSVSVFSGSDALNAYTAQTNLDNILRGGYPIRIGNDSKVLYVFNRKHGDLERDYNNFVLKPEFYSQGNGNFRDTNQNRRGSIWIRPEIGNKDIRDFYNLIQLDGYNPLVIRGDVFFYRDARERARVVREYFRGSDRDEADRFLAGEFTPGALIKLMARKKVKGARRKVFEEILRDADSHIDAVPGEGYWIDHWTYNQDLIDSYLALYPENLQRLLFHEAEYMFYDNPHRVKPRSRRYVKNGKGLLRQYDSVFFDKEKQALINARTMDRYWVRRGRGKGAVYKCTLAAKLITIILNKMATIDPFGLGIEMEADKPGWCDSLNGLPGIMGSSVPELAELLRVTVFLRAAAARAEKVTVRVPVEVSRFFVNITGALRDNMKANGDAPRKYWDRANALKEKYREEVRFGIDGREAGLDKEDITRFLDLCAGTLNNGIKKIRSRRDIPHTYYINEAHRQNGNDVSRFTSRPMPEFLEGPVRLMKTEDNTGRARKFYKDIKKSGLYDRKLKMYKLNTSLARESLEIGRIRVFTPGWLENESIWLHMEYKYLLEILKKGLYAEFYDEFRKVLIPFQDPARYGRSVLENSSFIVSSAFLNKDLHGAGFVARLSGATAEFLHILRLMNLGEKPFIVMGNELIFAPRPVLDKRLFAGKAGTVLFRFKDGMKKVAVPAHSYAFNVFENTLIVYENSKRANTFGRHMVKPARFTVTYRTGRKITVKESYMGEPISSALREGKVDMIRILLK